MTVILAVLFVLIFYVSIAMGTISYFEKTNKQWLYFFLSTFGLIGTILMFVFFHWDLGISISKNSKIVVEKKLDKNHHVYYGKTSSRIIAPTQNIH